MREVPAGSLPSLEAIRQLKARHCRFVDTKDWPALRALFTEDAGFEGLGSAPSGATLTTFIEGIGNRLRTATSVHHCRTPEITLTAPDRARGLWAMEDHVQWPPGFEVAEVPGHPGFRGYGHDEEEYARQGDEWRITFLRLTRIRSDALPVGHPAPIPGRFHVRPDWI